jgi:hypothetical protein
MKARRNLSVGLGMLRSALVVCGLGLMLLHSGPNPDWHFVAGLVYLFMGLI